MAKQYTNPKKNPVAQRAGNSPIADAVRSFLYDPNSLVTASQGTRPQSPRSLGLATLREMARACQPIGAIVRTRQNQVARFARLPRFKGDLGIEIRMRDLDAKPTDADRKQMRRLEDIILACGVAPDPSSRKRDNLEKYFRKLTKDGLTMDAMASELREDRRGNLFDWFAVDGATIRHAVPSYQPNQAPVNGQGMNLYGIAGEGYGGVSQPSGAEVAFVQLVNAVPTAEYTSDELAYWIRNPSTELEMNGYGHSELEDLIEVVTGFLNGMAYNGRFFTHSSIPEGVLSVVGNYTPENLDDFRRYWNAMVSGVNNAWRVPILASKDGRGVNWTRLKDNNKDMMFHEWMDFLTTLGCALYCIDREEIGFGAKGAGEPSSLTDGGNDSTIAHSLSKGLYPLLTCIEQGFNSDILSRLPDAEDFVFGFAGVDPDREDKEAERTEKSLNMGVKTVNMVRAEKDMKLVPEEDLWGDAPANATLFPAWQLAQQAKLQAQGMGDDGDQGDDGQAPDDDGDGQPPQLPKVNPDGSEEDDDQ